MAFEKPDPSSIPEPKNTPYTLKEMKELMEKESKLLISIMGHVFDVSSKSALYGRREDGKPGGYSVFVGKEASVGLGKSSLDENDMIDVDSEIASSLDWRNDSWYRSRMTQEEIAVLKDWFNYFKQRYPILGRIEKS